MTRAAAIYVGADELYAYQSSYHHGTPLSRYVLYENGEFSLQGLSRRWGFFEYTGRFALVERNLMMVFNATGTTWVANAELRGDTLSVRYNDLMLHSDFVDGAYVRDRVR